MDKENEQTIYIYLEMIAYQIASILSNKNERYIDQSLVYQVVKTFIKNNDIIEKVDI